MRVRKCKKSNADPVLETPGRRLSTTRVQGRERVWEQIYGGSAG